MLKIINATLLLREEGEYVTKQEDLWVDDGIIVGIGRAPEGTALRQAQGSPFAAGGEQVEPQGQQEAEVIDMAGRLAIPGLINMHTHAYMTCMRNIADDVDFDEWLFRRVMPIEESFSKEGAYYSALLGCMEMLSTGTTCFVDMHMYEGGSARAATESGMRAYIGRGLVGEDLYGDGKSRLDEAMREMELYGSDTVHFLLSPHAIYSCSEQLLGQVQKECAARGMMKQIHLSESAGEVENCRKAHDGKTPVEYLADMGFFKTKTIAAHCVQMQENDIELLKRHNVTVVTNPASNMKLGNGYAPVTEFREAGINLCIGTDGAASNNTLNMFREMTLLSMLHKGVQRSSVTMDAAFVLDCATVHAAKALSMEGLLGEIKEGALADIAFLDLKAVSLFPPNNIVSSLCYSANGSEVTDVMVAGKFAYRKREFTGVDEERVRFEVGKMMEDKR